MDLKKASGMGGKKVQFVDQATKTLGPELQAKIDELLQ